MTQEETQRALYETRLVLYRLIKTFEVQQTVLPFQQNRIEHGKMILAKYGDIKDALRNETAIKAM